MLDLLCTFPGSVYLNFIKIILYSIAVHRRLWDRVVGIVTRLRTGWSEARIIAWAGDFSLPLIVLASSGTHTSTISVGTGVLNGDRAAGLYVDHSTPSSAKVRMSRALHLL
jgi:hypothetical protein